MKTVTKYICEQSGKVFPTAEEARTHEEIEKRVAERCKPKAMTVGEVVAALERIAVQKSAVVPVYFEFAFAKPLSAEASDEYVFLRSPLELANGQPPRTVKDWITTLKLLDQAAVVRVDCGAGTRGTPVTVCGVTYRGWLVLLQTFWNVD